MTPSNKPPYHDEPASILCPRCHSETTTRYRYGRKDPANIVCNECDWYINFEHIAAEKKRRRDAERKKQHDEKLKKARNAADYIKRRGGSNPT